MRWDMEMNILFRKEAGRAVREGLGGPEGFRVGSCWAPGRPARGRVLPGEGGRPGSQAVSGCRERKGSPQLHEGADNPI